MKKNLLIVLPAVVLACAALLRSQNPAPSASATATKVATIQVQQAILSTADGKKAQNDLLAKFNSRKQSLEKKQSDLQNLQEQLKKGSATMSEDAKSKLMRDLETGQKMLQRDNDDFQSDVQEEENKIMQGLGQKIYDVMVKYATQRGYQMVVDVSNPQTPVLWADPGLDITPEIIKLYDQAYPAGAASKPAPASPAPATPKTVPPPATKK